MTLRFACVLVVVAAVGAGCGDDRRTSEDGQAVWTVEPAGEIGSIAGDDALADVLFVTVGPNSSVYVTQRQVQHVAVFDSTGTPLRRIGGPGMGPGELSPQPVSMGWKGDTLWVAGGGKTQLFTAEGRYLRGVAFRNPVPGLPELAYTPGSPVSGGGFVTSTSYPVRLVHEGVVTEGPILRVDAEGAVLDTLAWIGLTGRNLALSIRDGTLYMSHPYRSEPIWHVSADGSEIVIVERRPVEEDPPHFRVVRIAVTGDTLLNHRLSYRPAEIGPEDREGAIRDMLRQLEGFRALTEAELAAEIRESLRFPEHWPPVSHFVLGRDGHLWLRREGTGADSVRWQVLDREARHVADIWLPADLEVHYADERQIWGEVTDSLDVPYLRRYVLQP